MPLAELQSSWYQQQRRSKRYSEKQHVSLSYICTTVCTDNVNMNINACKRITHSALQSHKVNSLVML